MKAELTCELSKLVLNCTACGMEVHWISGVSMADAGHWGHRIPAPHGAPVVQLWCAMQGERRSLTSQSREVSSS